VPFLRLLYWIMLMFAHKQPRLRLRIDESNAPMIPVEFASRQPTGARCVPGGKHEASFVNHNEDKMLNVFGYAEALKTILTLSAVIGATPNSLPELKDSYQKLLHWRQPMVPQRRGQSYEIVTYPRAAAELLKPFNLQSPFNDQMHELQTNKDWSLPSEKWAIQRIDEALAEIKVNDRNFWNLLNLAINWIVLADSSTALGGTVSAAVGVLWVNPTESFTTSDRVEFLCHELTHTLLFLDEWRYSHFDSTEGMADREHYVLSAVQTVARPLDKVLHSIVVAAEILVLRERWLGHPDEPHLHPKSSTLANAGLASIKSVNGLLARIPFLSPRGQVLLQQCGTIFNQLRCRQV
jgi:hypothetical protein